MAKLNPVFSGIKVEEGIDNVASFKGVTAKTALLLGVAVLSAFLSITVGAGYIYDNPFTLFIVAIGAVICGIAGQVSANAAKLCSILYAVFEGVLLGLVSFAFDAAFSGIVMTAVLITATLFGVMLLLYSTNIIKVNGTFLRAMTTIGITIFAISLIYFISFIIDRNNILISALVANPGLVLLIEGFILLYGAFMLAFDFEQVNIFVANGFDKRYEWMASLGLMVTLIWIYIKVLRILAILMSRKD